MLTKTYVPKVSKQDEVKWFLFDAEGQVLGKLATEISKFLIGKNSPEFSYHLIPRVRVLVINAAKIRVTGAKLEQKKYYHHSHHPGNLKEKNLAEMIQENPTKVLFLAVKGMLPKNKLRKHYLLNLHIEAGSEHDKQAQEMTSVQI